MAKTIQKLFSLKWLIINDFLFISSQKSISMDSTGLNSNKFNNLLQYKTVPLNRMKFLIFVFSFDRSFPHDNASMDLIRPFKMGKVGQF